MAKKWLFWFCERSVCVSGQNQMCRLCGCLKLFLKNAGRQKKIKKHWGGLSVGLLAVPFQYGLYVFGHLSKWFVFVLMFKFWSVYRLWNGRPTIGYNGLQICDGRDFYHKCLCGAQNFRLPLNCLRSKKPRLLQMCCYTLPFFRPCPLTTIFSCLNWWTFNCPVATINTTVALMWF